MPSSYTIKVESFQGRTLTGYSCTPAISIEEGRKIFAEKVAECEQTILKDNAYKVSLLCWDPVEVVEEKTVRVK
jgi:hypothetical protein